MLSITTATPALQHRYQVILNNTDLRMTTKVLLKKCSELQAPIGQSVTIAMRSPVLAEITRHRLSEIESQLIPHLSDLFQQKITKVYIF